MDIKKFHEEFSDCSCKKEHKCPIDYVIIGKGVLGEIVSLCKGYKNILLVSDDNTYSVAGNKIANFLAEKVKKNLILKPNGKVVIPNEEKIEEIQNEVDEIIDLIVGVGSGVINDLCKYVSHKNNLPYYIVATAPSMDGYASVGSALILEGMKVTLNARPPKGILADTGVLKDAPKDMIKAGYGDIIGKYSCLNDWKLSAFINNEYFCQKVYDLTFNCANKVKNDAEGIKEGREEAIGALMEALVLVGVAMSFVGTSRPASGSEHHLSHYFEITGILDGKDYFPHGIDVGYSSVATAKIREEIIKKAPEKRAFDKALWKKEISRIYSSASEGVIALQEKLGWYKKDDSTLVYDNWDEIVKILKESPKASEFEEMLSSVGLDYEAFGDLYGDKKIEDALLYAKDLKDRYSVLWLYYVYFR